MNCVVTSKDNPLIKLYSKLATSKKERYALGKFVLEGQRLVEDAVKEKADVTCIFVTENAAGKFECSFSQADLGKIKLVMISNELGKKISLTEKTQGVFAICNFPVMKNLDDVIKNKGKFLILHKLQDPGNVGMIIRTADALGISGVVLSECCDLFSPKVIRSTMGSVFRMPLWWNVDIADALLSMGKYSVETCAAVIDADADDIKEKGFKDSCAVVIGNEGNGLSTEIVGKCQRRVTVCMNGNINSLNAAMAAGIIMWEMVN